MKEWILPRVWVSGNVLGCMGKVEIGGSPQHPPVRQKGAVRVHGPPALRPDSEFAEMGRTLTLAVSGNRLSAIWSMAIHCRFLKLVLLGSIG